MNMKEKVTERLMRYAKIHTTSNPDSSAYPTSRLQSALAEELCRELKAIGVEDVYFDEQAIIVYAKIPANTDKANIPSVGFIAHLDTSPEASGANVKPWVLPAYDGGDIILNAQQNIVMHAADYPDLARYIGQDLMLTDGTTLLGADDKAGIAELMTLAEYLITHPAVKHGTVCLAFTPDEEVGGLARDLDLARFGAQHAYTVDCDHLGYYSYETFNASQARIVIEGVSVHTGTAKGKMKNAADIAAAFLASLPERQKPQYTEGREGFFCILSCTASIEAAAIELIVRDFDADGFAAREALLLSIADRLNAQYGDGTVTVTITPQYRNMGVVITQSMHLVNDLKAAIEQSGVTPVCEPFRGGTDGAALSFRGLPCPNLSSGYENAHGRFEFISVQAMVKTVEILQNLCDIIAAHGIL